MVKRFFLLVLKHWLMVCSSIMLLLFELFWLVVLFFFLVGIYKLILFWLDKILNNTIRKSLKGLFLFLFVFGISIGLKLLVGDVYRVPSNSMEGTLVPGDVILVNKMVYGPKLPRNPFEISWVNLLFYLNNRARAAIDERWWPHRRLRGIKKIQSGDVIVYELNRTFFVVKRCIATAGNTFSIKKGEAYVDDKKYLNPKTVQNAYRIKVGSRGHFHKQMDSLGMKQRLYVDKKNIRNIIGVLSNKEKDIVITLKNTIKIEIELDTFNAKKKLFANPKDAFWTLDEMGPFIVPEKGMRIELNPFSFELYKKTIEEYEKTKITLNNGYFFLNNQKINSYTFKQDYYFVMGDNRKGSMDSRKIGFVPEENIVGKAQFILFSNYQEEFRWNRLIKEIK